MAPDRALDGQIRRPRRVRWTPRLREHGSGVSRRSGNGGWQQKGGGMTDLTAIGGHQLASLDDLPQRRAGERLEDLARELMMVTAMLCSAELRNGLCEAETVERAKRALQAGASARTGLRTVCQPATV